MSCNCCAVGCGCDRPCDCRTTTDTTPFVTSVGDTAYAVPVTGHWVVRDGVVREIVHDRADDHWNDGCEDGCHIEDCLGCGRNKYCGPGPCPDSLCICEKPWPCPEAKEDDDE